METVPIKEVAERLHMNPQGVREHLKRGHFTFGEAVPTLKGNQNRYIIPRAKFEAFMGGEQEKNE